MSEAALQTAVIFLHGRRFYVEYDAAAPCRCCGQPVTTAGTAGFDVCVWCATGRWRNGKPWSVRIQALMQEKLRRH